MLDGADIYTGCADGYMRHFDIRAGEVVADNMGGPIVALDLTGDKKSLLISDTKSQLRLFNINMGEELSLYKGHQCQKYPIKCKIAKDNSFFATGSEDGICYLYGFLDKKPIGTLYGHTDVVSGVDLNKKTGAAATCSFDGTVKYWVA